MNKQPEEIPEKKETEWLSGLLGVWMLICIAIAVIGFFVLSTPWANLFYCAAAMFAGGGIVGLFSPKQDEKDGGASGLILGAIILFITALVNGNWLWVGVAVIVSIYAIKKLNTKDKDDTNAVEDNQVVNELPEEDAPEVSATDLIKEGKLDIATCLTWFAQRGKKHNIPQEEWNKIRQDLIHFKHRMKESTLYLGVIGDASVGKSTFINALLGFEFLKENVTLGTTSTATVLKHGDEFAIRVNYSDGRAPLTQTAKDLKLPKDICFTEHSPVLAEAIAKFTAIEKEEDAAGIRSVEIFLPVENDLLKSNIAIVDTPGLHSGNEWHDRATTNAIKSICDIALILTSAKTPLPKNFIEYLNSNLSSVLPRCVLVMTQADTLDEDEREDQLDYIRTRLKKETKKDVANCYGVSAYYALERKGKRNQSAEDIENYRKEFDVMKNALSEYLQKGHEAALHDSLQDIIQNNFLPIMEQLLLARKETLQRRQNELKENQLSNLDHFINERIAKLLPQIDDFQITDSAIERELELVADDFERTVFARISNADSKDELKSAMSGDKIKSDIEDLMPALAKAINKLCSPLKKIGRGGIEEFSAEFKEAYSRLQNINSLNIADIKFSKLSVTMDSMDLPTNYFANAIEEQNNADNAKVGGGAAGGAAIGFLIGGPLGALVGGVGGAIFGALFGKSLATLKEEAKGTVRQISSSWQTQMKTPAVQACAQNKENCKEFVADAIRQYETTYGDQIKKIISAEKKEQKKLSAGIKNIEQDMQTLIDIGGQSDEQ